MRAEDDERNAFGAESLDMQSGNERYDVFSGEGEDSDTNTNGHKSPKFIEKNVKNSVDIGIDGRHLTSAFQAMQKINYGSFNKRRGRRISGENSIRRSIINTDIGLEQSLHGFGEELDRLVNISKCNGNFIKNENEQWPISVIYNNSDVMGNLFTFFDIRSEDSESETMVAKNYGVKRYEKNCEYTDGRDVFQFGNDNMDSISEYDNGISQLSIDKQRPSILRRIQAQRWE